MAKKKIEEMNIEDLENEVEEATENGISSISKLPGNIGQGRVPRSDYQDIPISQLVEYQRRSDDEDFSPMADSQFEEMVNSVRENGVLEAMSVRMLDFGKYEILAGHHRFEAAKEAGLTVIPAKVYKDLSDEQAEDIYNLTNLIRRELTFSDKCNGWWRYWETHKAQGARVDLEHELEESNDLVDISGISARQIRRYVKMHDLIPDMKTAVDQKHISARAAYPLSFLEHPQQDLIVPYLSLLTEKKAELLKQMSLEKQWDDDKALTIVQENGQQTKTFTYAVGKIRRYAKTVLSPRALQRVDEIFIEALDLYFQQHPEDRKESE